MTKESVNNCNSVELHDQSRRDQLSTESQHGHGTILNLIHQLEQKLATAAPRREHQWASDVVKCLRSVRDAFSKHTKLAVQKGGLIEELQAANPNLIWRLDRLQQRQSSLVQQMNSLITQADNHGTSDIPDFAYIRSRAAAILQDIRSLQAVENDLLFECFETDLGVGD